MAAKFKLGDVVEVPDAMPGVQSWWIKKPATVRAVLDGGVYEVLFHDGQDFAFIEEEKLVLLQEAKP
jgi:hypothetical protein